jgi:Fic family protein
LKPLVGVGGFESIHPFEDGNGRVGRAIVDMALAQGAQIPYRLHGISSEMRRQQRAYYAVLNAGAMWRW